MKRSSHAVAIVMSVLALCIAGCGSDDDNGGGGTTPKANLRLANATATELAITGVGATDSSATFSLPATQSGGVSSYASASAQTYTIGIAGTGLTPSTQSTGLSGDTTYTLLAYERSGSVNSYLLTDGTTTPAAGFASFNIANVGNDAGTLDVYLVAPSSAPGSATPSFNGVGARTVATPKTITAGTYDVIVTASGKPTDVRLTLPTVTLASADIVVLALTSTIGGGLVDGALVKQGGALEPAPTGKARVRVVGGFPPDGGGNATIAVSIGANALNTLTAPSVGAYKLVDGGATAYSVAVNGAPAPNLPMATFAKGGDYTVLVAGTPTAPQVIVLTDNNQPSSSGYAHVRLLNAAVPGGGITLSHNYLPLNSDVQYGQASNYTPTTPLNNSLLQITSPVAAFPTYSATNVSILAGGVYTIFALGSTTTPVIVFSKDR